MQDAVAHLKRLTRISIYRPNPESSIAPVVPPDTEIIELIISGRAFLNQEGRQQPYGGGTCFWHGPGESLIFTVDPKAECECVCFIYETLQDSPSTAPRINAWNDVMEARRFALQAVESYHHPETSHEHLGLYIYTRLIWERDQARLLPLGHQHSRPLRRALTFMRENLSGAITLDDVALAADCSVPRLHQLFSRNLSITPHRHLMHLRMQEARKLLATTNLAVKAIAGRCGYSNPDNFIRAFRQRSGLAPGAYRRLNRQPILLAREGAPPRRGSKR